MEHHIAPIKKILVIIWESSQLDDGTWHKHLQSLQPSWKLMVQCFLIAINLSNGFLLRQPYLPVRSLETIPRLHRSLQHFNGYCRISLYHGKYGCTDNIRVQLQMILGKGSGQTCVWPIVLPNFPPLLFPAICNSYTPRTPITKMLAFSVVCQLIRLQYLVLNRSSNAVIFYSK